MRRCLARLTFLAVVVVALASWATPAEAQLVAFPGAEGFGAYSQGGRGGVVYHVTNLNDSGAGSLREAVIASGPRTVVFDVSGTIQLRSKLDIKNPYITVAGQTAPGDGICVRDYSFLVDADHVIVRFIRSRLGDVSGQLVDALSINSGHNVIIDHCSASWCLDENLSCSTADPVISDITVQWCYITEALNPNDHSFGSLIRGCHGARYTYSHNLYAHNRGRNPRPGNYDDPNTYLADPDGLLLDFRNNLIYNWRGSYAGYNADLLSVTKLNYVGNYLIPGPESSVSGIAYRESSRYNTGYFAGNYYNGVLPADPWSVVDFHGWTAAEIAPYKQSAPYESGPMVTEDGETALEHVLLFGGACLPSRDPVDTRVTGTVLNGTGAVINSQTEVGGWPTLATAPPPLDTDRDGMPDAWEQAHGLNLSDPADRNGDLDGDGYTNLEEYLNGLVKPTVTLLVDRTQVIEGGASATLTVSRWGYFNESLTVPLQVGGTAGGADHNPIPAALVIPAGQPAATFSLAASADDAIEGSETIDVAVADLPDDYERDNPNGVSLQVLDTDKIWVQFGFQGYQMGTETNPYAALSGGVQSVDPAGLVVIRSGASPEIIRIPKALRIEASGGPVRIGAP